MAETGNIHIDQQYIEGLLQNDAMVIDTIYKKFSPGIKRWIIANSAITIQERENMVMGLFKTLGDRCREIIQLTQKKEFSQEEIATKLGLTYAYLRKKKSECMASLIKKVQASGFQM